MDVVGKDIYEKEQEWRHALDARMRHLVHTIEQRDREISQLKEKLNMLEKDFFYNLKLLQERDVELEKYESTVQSKNELIGKYTDELGDFHTKFDHLQMKYEILVKENKEQKEWFIKEIDKEKMCHEESKRAFQKASEEWKITFSKQQDISQKEINELQNNLEQKKRELEEQHSNIVCQMKQELFKQKEQANKDLSKLTTKVQQLEQNIYDLNSDNTRLKTENASLQLMVHNNKSLFEVEIEQIRTTIKNKDQQLQHIVSTNLIYENEIKEILKIIMNYNQTDETIKQPLSVAETIAKLKSKVNSLLMIRDENKLLNEKLESKLEEINRLRSLKTTDEMQTVLKQNQVLREVVKDLKKKLNTNSYEIKSQGENTIIQSFDNHNLASHKQNVTFCDLKNVEVSENFNSGIKLNENTNKECITSKEIFELLKNHLADQKNNFESQLQILNVKIENLGKIMHEQNIEEESSSRVARLERTISQLKEHTLKDIYEKMKGKHKTTNQDITPGDIRMMLLEEKIDRIAETVGKTVVTENNVLLEAVDKIKIELVAHLMEQIKESNLQQKTQKCSRPKSDEILELMKAEISRLEAKIENKNKEMVNNQNCTLNSNLQMNAYKNSECQTSVLGENINYNSHITSFSKAKKRSISTQANFSCNGNTSRSDSEITSISVGEFEIEKLQRLLNDVSRGNMDKESVQNQQTELPVQSQRNIPEQLQSAVLKTKKSSEQKKHRKAN